MKLGDKTVVAKGRLILAAGFILASGVVGGGLLVNQIADDGTIKTTTTVAHEYLNVSLTTTGSATNDTGERYAAACVANPLLALGLGSGAVRRIQYSNSANPNGVSADIGFVKSCTDNTSSGQSLINDSCTATGCVAWYTTGTATWNSADYIKVTFDGDPTSDYSGRIRIEYEDYYGE